jgi:hypothetical protein
MKNILYTFIFQDHKDSYDCVGLCSQIKKTNSGNILAIFDNKECFDIYKEQILIEKEYISYIEKRTISIQEILKKYYHKYKYFFISKYTKVLINQNYIHNENLTKPTVFLEEKDILGVVFSLESLLKSNLIIDNIINNNIDEKFFNIQRHNLPIKTLKVKNNKEIQNVNQTKNILYENQLCLFAFLQGSDNLVDSMCYFNKNNNKIYSVNNNVMGEVIYYDTENLKINWKITEKISKVYEYIKNENIYYIK